ncbi:sensor histidine kinase [Planifilum fimeticola]
MTVAMMGVLFGLVLLLLLVHLRRSRQIRRMADTLEEFAANNRNLRIRLFTKDPSLTRLALMINRLAEQFQGMEERTAYLEAERKRLLTHVSHDLRTPLTSLLGYAEALRRDADLTDREREEYLEVIEEKARRLTVLINDFFDLAKLEAGDAEIRLRPMDVCERVRGSVLTFYREITEAGLTPEIRIPDREIRVQGDPYATERILNNLIGNALRYGREGGVIGVGVREEEKCVWVEVWDRGPGIPEEELPRIFDRLHTGDRSRNPHLRGSGLGLTIVKQLVEKQKGEIRVASDPHRKTVFSFSLMRAEGGEGVPDDSPPL